MRENTFFSPAKVNGYFHAAFFRTTGGLQATSGLCLSLRKEKPPARMDALMARVDYTNARVTFAFVTHATSPEFSS